MENQWVTRVINIRASLEKSKTVVVHEYSQSPVTKRLVYNISHAALELITLKVPAKAQKKAVKKSHIVHEVKNDLPDLNELPYLYEVDEQYVLPGKVMLKRKKVQCPIKAPKQRRKYTKMTKTNSQDMSYDDEYLGKLIQGITFHNPKVLSDVVERLENVAPDGHCGFRACAEMLGLSADVGIECRNVGIVKIEMERELTVNSEMYIPIIGGVEEYKKILTTLRYRRPFATRLYWMVFPDMGYIFASAFNCIFSSYSNMGSTTWLPLRTPPPAEFKVVTIFNLDNEHFVKAILKPGAPLPPVLSRWNSICTEEALVWTPHMEMLHRGWENIDQKQPGHRLQVIEEIHLDEP
ncbi:hypothetical protein MKW92_041190 [Papaver armeniacum]|nr:hypothetical protein MKW92_041190 [Papaver armeniacum]